MSSRVTSFLRDSGRFYLLYLFAGMAAIPAGIIYAIAALEGYDRWWTALLSIVLGLWSAFKMWKYVELRLFKFEYGSMLAGSVHANIEGITQAGLAAIPVLSPLDEGLALAAQFRSGNNSAASQSLPVQAANENTYAFARN